MKTNFVSILYTNYVYLKAPSLKGDSKLLINILKVQLFHFLFTCWVSFNYSFTKFGNHSQTNTFSSTSLKFFLLYKKSKYKTTQIETSFKICMLFYGGVCGWWWKISKLSVKHKMSRFNSYDRIGKDKPNFNAINNYYETMYIHTILSWSDWLTNS